MRTIYLQHAFPRQCYLLPDKDKQHFQYAQENSSETLHLKGYKDRAVLLKHQHEVKETEPHRETPKSCLKQAREVNQMM